MKLYQTSQGIVRQLGDELTLLDSDGANLDAVLRSGSLWLLASAPSTAAVEPSFITDAERLLPVVQNPGRFVIAGLNYKAHCEEIGRPVPDRLLFGFAPGSAAHPAGVPVRIPPEASLEVDYEGEIGVVISATASRVSAADALAVIAGYVPVNDVSARDVQAAGTREAVGLAKGFPTFKPLGPCLATLDEFDDPLDVGIKTRVNGELRQRGRSSDMVFSIPEIISVVSAAVTLEPGDVICTGTPGGVAHGGKHPYLRAGDVVEVEVEGLPVLSNTFR